MELNKSTLKILRQAMQKALDEAGIQDIDFSVGNCTYEPASAVFKVSAKVKGAKTVEDKALVVNAKLFGLVTEKNGKKLVSYKTRNHKYPWIYEANGKRWKCSDSQAKMLFGK